MRVKILEYRGFFIEKHSLFYVIDMDYGPETFRSLKEAKNWIDEFLEK